jgi:hypothetical protein
MARLPREGVRDWGLSSARSHRRLHSQEQGEEEGGRGTAGVALVWVMVV